MKKFPELETARLNLIKIDYQHVEPYFNIMHLDEVTAYYGMDSLKNKDEAVKIIDSFHTFFEEGRSIRWGIVLKDTEEFIGTIGLNQLNSRGRKAEIGFELHPTYWKKGITTEAIEAVLDYTFNELNLFRMGAITFPANTASNNLLKKIGFIQEGKLRGYLYQNNQSHDALVYSLLKPEWIKTHKKEEFEIEERLQYTDHMSAIIKNAEKEGHFDNLPGKGKPLNLGRDYFNPPEKQLYKTLKDNNILPRWVELANEIDQLKEEAITMEGKEKRKKMKEINKKIKEYNYACPPSLQKNKVVE